MVKKGRERGKRAKKDSKEVNKGGTRRVQKVWKKNGEGGESVKK